MSLRRQALVSAPATTRDAEKAGRDEALATLLAISKNSGCYAAVEPLPPHRLSMMLYLASSWRMRVLNSSERMSKNCLLTRAQGSHILIRISEAYQYMRKSAYDKPPNNR